jgi:hypothetical protein
MAIQAVNLMVGPGRLWYKPFDESFDPATIVAAAAPSFSSFTDIGATDDGLNITVAKSYTNHTVDQTADWVASTITERSTRVEVNLAEPTLANLSLALNGGTTASVNASWDSYEPNTDLISTQEEYITLAIEGVTLGGKKSVLVINKALNVDDTAFSYKKDTKTMFGCNWGGHYVSEDVAPFIQYIQHTA